MAPQLLIGLGLAMLIRCAPTKIDANNKATLSGAKGEKPGKEGGSGGQGNEPNSAPKPDQEKPNHDSGDIGPIDFGKGGFIGDFPTGFGESHSNVA